MDKPNEEPQVLDYRIGDREFVSVTPMGNWLAMREDRDRFRDDWQAMIKQIDELAVENIQLKGLVAEARYQFERLHSQRQVTND